MVGQVLLRLMVWRWEKQTNKLFASFVYSSCFCSIYHLRNNWSANRPILCLPSCFFLSFSVVYSLEWVKGKNQELDGSRRLSKNDEKENCERKKRKNLREINKERTATTGVRFDLSVLHKDDIKALEMGKYRNRNLIVT